MRMGNFLCPGVGHPGMATRERKSVGPPFGIAHATVVPGNYDPERAPDEDDVHEE